jgi:hypothetical protein
MISLKEILNSSSSLILKLINSNIFNILFAEWLKILIKICRKYSLKKLEKVIALLFLFYQIISLTINYLEYETVIDTKAVSNIEQRPTFSFCEKTQNEFNGHYSIPLLNESFDQPIGCQIYPNNTETIYCEKLTRIVESVTPFSHRCLTYFSQLLDKNASSLRKYISTL